MNWKGSRFLQNAQIDPLGPQMLREMFNRDSQPTQLRHEFLEFVREGLGLSMWDVPESELLQRLDPKRAFVALIARFLPKRKYEDQCHGHVSRTFLWVAS